MKRQYKFGRIIHALSPEEKALFKEEEVKSLDLLNKKLNLIIDILTEIEDEDLVDSRELKEIHEQSDPLLSTDAIQGQAIIESTLKNAEMEEAMTSIGQGVVEIMLNQQMGGM